jgi:YVTN family beta-propeller protein
MASHGIASRMVLLALPLAALAANTLLVVHKLDDSFGFYDAATGKLEAKVATGAKPHEFALSADRRFAYVTNYGADTYTETQSGGNTITIVDLKERRAAGEIALGDYHRPHGIERGKSGRFYITTDMPAAVVVLDAKKRKVLSAIPVTGKLPHMIQLRADERQAWTADAGSGTVSVVDLAARRQRTQIDVGGVPMGLALASDEKTLFVATRTNNMVVAVDAVTNRVKRQIGVPGQPVRLALSKDDRWLYVSLIESGEIAVLDTRILLEVKRVTAGKRAEGMHLEPSGNFLYVSAQADNQVLKFSLPDLERVQTIETPAKPDPVYLLADEKPASRGR